MKQAEAGASGSMPLEPTAVPVANTRLADYVALTKPRLNLLVVITTLVGYYLGSRDAGDFIRLLNTVMGTALVAGGGAAFNQVFERDTDRLMRRTRGRPLPRGRLRPVEAGRFAGVLSAAGLIQLALGANLLAAAVALVTLGTYVAMYTPIKRRSWVATIVGAIPGALPPVIGWTAARGTLSVEAWILFAIVFFWQIPHFLAIAWMYRDDYSRAGIPLLPVVKPDGRSTAHYVVACGVVLIPASLLPAAIGLAGDGYIIGALVLGVTFLALGVRFARHRSMATARWLFVGSIAYLPLLWTLLVAGGRR